MKVYIAGAVQQHPSPEVIREEIKSHANDRIVWIDPLDYEPSDNPQELIDVDIELVGDSDGILVYWVPELATWGTAAELYHATQIEDKPAVVWQVGALEPDYDAIPEWLEGMSDAIVTMLDDAIDVLYAKRPKTHA